MRKQKNAAVLKSSFHTEVMLEMSPNLAGVKLKGFAYLYNIPYHSTIRKKNVGMQGRAESKIQLENKRDVARKAKIFFILGLPVLELFWGWAFWTMTALFLSYLFLD